MKSRTERKLYWQLALRFEPTFTSESQIIITKKSDAVEIERFETANGWIFNTISSWLDNNQKEDIGEMSKLVKVERCQIPFRSQDVSTFYQGFMSSIAPTSKTFSREIAKTEKTDSWDVVLHGTRYKLWFFYKGNQMSFSTTDHEMDNSKITGLAPLIRWMNKVRLEVNKRSKGCKERIEL